MTERSTADLLARRERLLGVGMATFYEDPVHIVRGEGVWLYDADGRRYLDLYNNVPCVGHGHPHVVEAMQRQTETLNVHSRYLHEGILDYAERLTELHAEPISTAVFTCSGTEANEVAVMMARAATGGRGLNLHDRRVSRQLDGGAQAVAAARRRRPGVPLDPGAAALPADRGRPR